MHKNGARKPRATPHPQYLDNGAPLQARSVDAELADHFLTGELLMHEIDAIESARLSIDLGDGNRQKTTPRYE